MVRLAMLFAAIFWAVRAFGTEQGAFVGRVVVEWIDDDPFIQKMRVAERFGYRDSKGKVWLADGEHILDGRSFPPLTQELTGPVFAGELRRASLVYDYQCKAMIEPWRAVHRMFYEAVRTQGMPAIDAKLVYTSVYALGPRWETKDSSCFRTCHSNLPSLSWKPQVEPDLLTPVMAWIRGADPSLEQIERRLNALIL